MKRRELFKKVIGGAALATGIKSGLSLGNPNKPILITKDNIVQNFEYVHRMVSRDEAMEIWGTGIPQMIRDSQIELNARIKRMVSHYETQKSSRAIICRRHSLVNRYATVAKSNPLPDNIQKVVKGMILDIKFFIKEKRKNYKGEFGINEEGCYYSLQMLGDKMPDEIKIVFDDESIPDHMVTKYVSFMERNIGITTYIVMPINSCWYQLFKQSGRPL